MQGKTLQAVFPPALLWGEVCGSARGTAASWECLTCSLAAGGSVPHGRGSRSGGNPPSQGFPFTGHLLHRRNYLVGGFSPARRAKQQWHLNRGNFLHLPRGPELLTPCKRDGSHRCMALLYRPTLGVWPGECESSYIPWWDASHAVVM